MADNKLSINTFFETNVDTVKTTLGNEYERFVKTLTQIVVGNAKLQECSPESIYLSALKAVMLNLDISPNLGYAYIIPYGKNATFQIGYKGLIQLLLRSGLLAENGLSATCIYEGQIVKLDYIQGHQIDTSVRNSDKIVGYAAFLKLKNGFSKVEYWTLQEIEKHAKKYSKTFAYNDSVWKKDFDAMAKKTVLNALVKTYAPLSTDIIDAINSENTIVDSIYENVEELKETLALEVIDWQAEIFNANNDSELLAIWGRMNKEEQAQMKELFTQRKTALKNAATK